MSKLLVSQTWVSGGVGLVVQGLGVSRLVWYFNLNYDPLNLTEQKVKVIKMICMFIIKLQQTYPQSVNTVDS